jgi:DNA polymerase-1
MYYDMVLDEDFPEQVEALKQGAEYWDHRMILPTAVMMWKGICVDEENVRKREKEIMKDLPRLKKHLQEEHGVDPNAPASVLTKLVEYGENIHNTREEILKEVKQTTSSAASDDLITTLLEYRNLNTVLTRYIQGLPSLLSADGRVHSYLQIAKAVTGRGASSNPNLENIPKHVRDIICSDKGELWTYDRSQSEYRCVAYLSQIESIIRDYMAGKDLHTFTAEFFGIPRKDAKNINFAGIFDATLEKLMYMLIKCGMEQGKAKELAQKFIQTLDPVKRWQRAFVSQAYRQGYVETPTGRRSYRLRKQQIVNTPIQGWSADLNKRTVCEFFDEIWSRRLESYVWLEFHDGTELNVMPGEEHEIEDIASCVFQVLPDIYDRGIHLPFPLEKEVHGKHWHRGS